MKDEYSIDYSIPENEVSFLKGMIREYYQPEIERLNNIIDNAKEYIELLENAFIKGEQLDIVLLDTERQILEGDEMPDITIKYLKEKIKSDI